MNYPAASNGVSIGIFIIAPRGGELNLYPPQEGLSALRRDFFTADLQHLQWRMRMQHQGDTTLSGLK